MPACRSRRRSAMKLCPAHGLAVKTWRPASRARASSGGERGSVSSLTANPEPVDNFQIGRLQLPHLAAVAVLPKSDMEPRPTFFLFRCSFLPRPRPDPNPVPHPLKGGCGRGFGSLSANLVPPLGTTSDEVGRRVAFTPYCPNL